MKIIIQDKKWTVYKHTSPSGKVYIGITSKDPKYRWSNGKGYRNTYFANAIKKYGWDNIEHEILFTDLNENDAKEMEKELIAKYNSNNRKYGYNMTKGGNGTLGIKRSKKQVQHLKDLLSKTVYQRDLNGNLIKEWESIREIHRILGYARSNITQCCKGKTYQAYGFLWSYDKDCIRHKEKRKNCKIVYQYDLDGNFIKEWGSLIEIQEVLGYLKANISHCCLGKYQSAYGFIWSYERNKNIQYINKNLQKQKKIFQLTKNMEIIKEWNSLEDIEKTVGYSKSAVSSCCLCKSKTAYGYIWRYEDTLNKVISLTSAQAKPVVQLDKEHNIIAEFDSIAEAHEITGINNISYCCLGKRKTAGGYIWIYSDNFSKTS